jgi:hypothetical protein
MHQSCSFAAVMACVAAGAHADAQHATGEGICVRAWLIS